MAVLGLLLSPYTLPNEWSGAGPQTSGGTHWQARKEPSNLGFGLGQTRGGRL